MKSLFALLIFLWLPLSSHANVIGGQVKSQTPSPLVLRTKILSRYSCRVNQNLGNLELRVQLQFTNVSDQKLILYKGHDLFYQTRFRRVAMSGATSDAYEVTILNSRYFDEQPEKIDQPTPGKVFVILQPGATFETVMTVGVGVVGSNVNRGNHALKEGEHSLQLIVSTWYKSKSLAQKMRQQWQRKGLLWFDPVVSTPVNFRVENPESQFTCR
ncbi:MAG TPA: hypothetical protein VM911_19400 [Pyrinomonadaceae bacterium]|jgi:hypothetical protein|nr:hypothetical protein [Pyrinomonadaceae bacterium]